MSSYVVIDGDTFDQISRKVYGEESNANLLRRSNPGIVEPLAQGTLINVPTDPNAPVNNPQVLTSNTIAQVTIAVKVFETVNRTPQLGSFFDESIRTTKQFTFWTSITIKRSLDSLSTIAVTAPWNPDDENMREFFRPFTFREITVSVGGNPLFVGTIVNVVPNLSENTSTVQITAYSLPGIMNDCTPPVSDFPLSWDQYTLKEIAQDVSASFGVGVRFDEEGKLPVFENVAAKPETKALQFLQELAKQQNFIIGDTREGELLFHKSTQTGFPVARLEEGNSPLISVSPSFNGQITFSSLSGINPMGAGISGEAFTVQTGMLGGRYLSFAVKDTLNASMAQAVNTKMGRMYGNMATFVIRVATWFDPFGTLWTPNTTIKVLAPSAMIYVEYEFIIRTVEYLRTAESEFAQLDLVLPGAFSGEAPASLPWE